LHTLNDVFRVNYGNDLHDLKTACADGSVRIEQGTRWFTGRDALLDPSSRTIVLTGSATMDEVGGETNAPKITIHLETDRNVLEQAIGPATWTSTARATVRSSFRASVDARFRLGCRSKTSSA